MKIVQINAVYGIMSTGRNVMELSDFLKKEGNECITFYGGCQQPSEKDIYFMGSTLTHKIHALTSRLFSDAGRGSIIATKKLLRFLEEYKPDIVHLNNLHGNFIHINVLLEFLAKNDIPTVVHLHDCFFFTGGCMHYTSNDCFKWLVECDDCQFLQRGKNFIFSNRANRNLKNKIRLFSSIPRLAVCGVSKWTENEARRSPVFANAKIITHIYNWVDLDIFKPQSPKINDDTRKKLNIGNSPMILGVASVWGRAKGLNDFNKLAQLLTDFTIVLVGRMPLNVNLAPNIIAVGSTESVHQLVRLYSASDVFVHLSLEETFGKVTAEALACGTPAIVYDSTASPELVSSDTGAVLKPGDIYSVAKAVTDILTAPQMSDACRTRAISLFDMSTNIRAQIKVYNDLITSLS